MNDVTKGAQISRHVTKCIANVPFQSRRKVIFAAAISQARQNAEQMVLCIRWNMDAGRMNTKSKITHLWQRGVSNGDHPNIGTSAQVLKSKKGVQQRSTCPCSIESNKSLDSIESNVCWRALGQHRAAASVSHGWAQLLKL